MGTNGFFFQTAVEPTSDGERDAGPRAPGKVTLTSRIPARAGAVVQRKASGAPAPGDGPVDAIAAAGVAGAGSCLPYLDRIAVAFGHHDVSGVRVASDRAAVDAGRRLGASAYAYGDTIAAAAPLDLHTAAHEAAHVIQQRAGLALPGGMSSPGDASEREADAIADVVVGGGSAVAMLDTIAGGGGGGGGSRGSRVVQRDVTGTSAMAPEACPTFEMWMSQFRDLPAFSSADAADRSPAPVDHDLDPNVLGDAAAPRDGRQHGAAASPTAPQQVSGRSAGDRFIDHPTDAWVRRNLPEELVITAYQLPTDCADVAAVLRHVWLNAHDRTERYPLRGRRGRTRIITLGAELGRTAGARRAALGAEIAGGRASSGVNSGNAAGMVQTYRDEHGAPILDWDRLSRRLHAGDMVVWEHRDLAGDRATGGHVQTVRSIERDGAGTVTAVRFIAGNQPLYLDDAIAIRGRHRSERRAPGMDIESLRDAPGRRLELQDQESLHDAGVGSTPNRWGRQHEDSHGRPDLGYTVVIAAGPASAETAPRAAGAPVRLADWTPRVTAAADAAVLRATFEAALAEARAAIEGGGTVPAAELATFGAAASARATAIDATGRVRAALLETAESMAAARGSTEDAALHQPPGAATSGRGRNDRNPRLIEVRAAFAAIRTALGGAADSGPSATLMTFPPRLDAAANQPALDAVWTLAVDAVALAAGADPEAVAAIARHAGERVWALARANVARPGDRGMEHFDAVYRMRAVVATRSGGAVPAAAASLTALDDAFDRAARGMSTIDWTRAGPESQRVRRVLLTGFDPFTGEDRPPTPGDWNPAGAAVQRLDGQTLAIGGEQVAIEGVVFPVSFAQFGSAIVEQVVGAQADTVDAVLTVSEDPNLSAAAGERVRLEQYAVGIRQTSTLLPHQARGREVLPEATVRVPAVRTVPGTTQPSHAAPVLDASDRDGDRVHETDLAGIAAGSGTQVRDHLELHFVDQAAFTAALTALGAHATDLHDPDAPFTLRITDPATTAAIAAETRGQFAGAATSSSPSITFHAGAAVLTADLVGGPGGSFLSNEIGYRAQRELLTRRSDATSFHIHTTGADTDLAVLIATLQRVITEVITRRQAAARAP